MAVDETVPLPSPPPPRPAARQAAIEAALRKFDGETTEAPARERPRKWWADLHRRPAAGLVTAALIAVISVPAAMIALRDQPVAEAPIPRTPPAPPPIARPNAVAVEAPSEPAATGGQAAPAARSAAPLPLEPHTEDARLAAAEEGIAAPITATPAPAAPPPPPPAPSPPPAPASKAVSEQYAAELADDSIVVTGSHIPQRGRERPGNGGGVAERSAMSANMAQEHDGHRRFLARLQRATRSDDRDAMLDLVALPLRVNFDGGSRSYNDRASIERDFDRIFTRRVRQAILAQSAGRLFTNDQGAMIGNGQVWFDATCPNPDCNPPGAIRIKAIKP